MAFDSLKYAAICFLFAGSIASAQEISQLPSATTPLTGSEQIPCVQSNVTKKCLVSSINPGASVPAHAVYLGTGTTTPGYVAPGTSGYVLTSNGGSADPTFQAASGTGTVTSVTAGTGLTATPSNPITASGTINVTGYLADLAGLSLSQGDILYFNGSNLTNLGAGTMGQYLQTQGASANPQWAGGVSFPSAMGLAGSSAGGGVTASFTATSLIAKTTLSGTAYLGTSLSLSFNGAGTGAGGMDTGSVPTSGSLCIYAITNGKGTWNTLGYSDSSCATIYAGAHWPSGYTASALIWAGITDGSAHIQKFGQVGSKVFEAPINVLNITSSVPTTFTSVSLTSALPANAVVASGILGQPSGNIGLAAVAADTSGTGEIIVGGQNGVGVSALDNFTADTGMFAIPLTTASTLYYKSALSSIPVRISITGYTLPIGAN
ncbi:MAG: hypothetical protein KGL39_43970 [Patescibacteria group bacterium]|nr:hypothetical protein [Patescibacteria group bacterium]